MTADTDSGLSETSVLFSRLAVGCAALFAVLLIGLHFLEPEFDPLWRMISEYETGAVGWLMRIAFFAWGVSVLLLTSALWGSLRTPGGAVGKWWMAIIGLLMIGAGIFEPNPITENTPNLHNTLHTVCGAVVILTFPIASTLVSRSLVRTHGRLRRFISILIPVVWIGMVADFASIIISDLINPSAGIRGPLVYQGWPNRLMVATYTAWILSVGVRLPSTDGQEADVDRAS